jgi:S1/P1 nuclease
MLMSSIPRELVIAISIVAIRSSLFGYGPTGHEIVGGIADKLIANTPAAEKIYALTDGITLERASTIADEIRAWDKNGVDDLNAFPHYAEHPKIDKQLREFWRANPPTEDRNSPVPSHHWFHYADVPVLNLEKYSEGKTGRSQWDVVHMLAYCIDVLHGEVTENNPRKITKPIAIILLAHYVGDIHQPLHVGAEYFNHAGQAVDPDRGQAGIEDEGGNLLSLRLTRGRREDMAKRGLKLHGFWDNEGVMANLPAVPADLTREERFKLIEPAKRKIIDRFAKEQPKNWRAPANVALKNYATFWADEILPVAKEAHERLRFVNVHETIDQEKTVMAGDAREKNMPDHVAYADWVKGIVRDELHKAGWRLADLLTQAVGSQ